MKFFKYFFLLSLILSHSFAATEMKATENIKFIELSSQDSKVEFSAIGKPSMLKINGTGGKLKGRMEFQGLHVRAACVVPLDSITTGIDLRDNHMKNKYLEIGKFPEASLTITELLLEKNYLMERLDGWNGNALGLIWDYS